MHRYSVNIPPRIIAGLRRHAAATLPSECCGALAGTSADARLDLRAMIPLDNEDPAPGTYRIEARTVRRLERQATDAGVELLGFYHSHPAGTAEPSAADLELACPGYVYVIVQADVGTVRAWVLRSDRGGFDELPVCQLAGAV
jgi:proteasome lid subunit RPN8/RPN11